MNVSAPLLTVDDLVVEYRRPGFRAAPARVIHGVSFTVDTNETVALVGESGSGKTTIGRAILGSTPVAEGTITFGGRDITRLRGRERRGLASDLQVVFQNPYGSLNPALTVGRILAEPLVAGGMSRADATRRITDLLTRVGMPTDSLNRYPGSFSGGQRQRIAIARAVARNPKLIVCDEPTSALDVSTQAAVLSLLAELQSSLGVSYLFVTHDLAIVREFAHRAIVLERGRIAETGTSAQICERPTDPYTQRLLAAAPVPDPIVQRERRQRRLELERG